MKSHVRLLFVIVILPAMFWWAGSGCAQPATANAIHSLRKDSPPVFIENRGQSEDAALRYKLNHQQVHVELSRHGADFRLPTPRASGELAFSVRFVGSQLTEPVGANPAGAVFHYYPEDARRRRENVPAWREVLYRNLYPGIDLQVTAQPSGLKYEFHLAPGTDWRDVQVHYSGVERLELREDGSLAIHLGKDLPPLVDRAPVIYQERNGRRISLAGRFALVDATTCGFELDGEPDRTLPLVIDPEIEWGSYVGDNLIGGNTAHAVAVDSAGNVLLAGESPGFVAKVSPAGTHLWSAMLGSDSTVANAIAVDAADNVLVAGYTTGAGWTVGGHQTNYQGNCDGFLAKFNAAGQLLWSTYIGGTNLDMAFGLAVDALGRAVVVGQTFSSHWVSTGPPTVDGSSDGFVAQYETNGVLLASAYLAQPGTDSWVNTHSTYNVVSGEFGLLYLCGWAEFCEHSHFPPQLNCFTAPYVMKLPAVGSMPDWTVQTSVGLALARDGNGDVLVAGTIPGGPTWNSVANVTKLNALGGQQWSRNVGGAGADQGMDVAVDNSGNVFLTGWTESTNWASGGFDTNHHGMRDAFIAKISPGGTNLWSAYLGGTNHDYGYSVALDGHGNLFVVGETWSPDWLLGGFDSTPSGSMDAFVVKLVPAGNLTVTLVPPPAITLGAKWRRLGTTHWLDPGSTEAAVPPGNHIIEFKEVPDWRAPVSLPVSLADGQSLVLQATYTPRSSELAAGAFVGGSLEDRGRSVTVDAQGNVLLAGYTGSSGWVSSGYDTSLEGSHDAFVIKWSADGIPLWSTYVGGAQTQYAESIAVDRDGNILVAGVTTGGDWATGGYDTNYGGGNGDGFVVKISAAGQHLWSTYLGGEAADYAYAVTTDASNNVLVAGFTRSTNWVSGGFDNSYNGAEDAFVVKLSPGGAHLWSSYLGGNSDERAYSLAVDSQGNVAVVGSTSSAGWVSGGFDTSYNGGGDAFLTKLNSAGNHLWTTYLGGTTGDSAHGVTCDPADNLLVVGSTSSTNWISGGHDTSHNGGSDAFVFKLTPGGAPGWSIYLGGTNADFAWSAVADRGGNVFVVGNTDSGGWTVGGPDLTHNGDTDAFVARLTSAGALVWSSHLGGTNTDEGHAVAHDGASRIFIAGSTKPGVWDYDVWATNYHGGTWDAFVATFTDAPLPLIRIHRIEPLGTSSFRLVFTVTTDPPPTLQVQRASSLAAPVSWVTESGALITQIAPGLLHADVPRQAGQCFYRLLKP